ncbi:DUF4145 domain-containing protein [Paenibacillus piscarius]|uniref:DUF4145 domain-containing protein n=1 Tax=Paenibacillus piscarius TaxID=1089681 RepID=UPI001EE8A3AD|nr:DUF4145 domain-containing protein [Paenibacillus piscarius]
MLDIREWKWEKVKPKDKAQHTLSCPYCNVKVRAISETRIFDADTGAIKYHIFKCPECFMPITIGIDGEIIPTSQLLPFEDIPYLPSSIEKMYCECRKCFSNACFYSVIMVARTLIMHISADLGATSNLRFVEYINYLEQEGYISRHNRTWVDKIRKLGNQYIHELDEATEDEAKLAITFIKHLLINVYELPQMAQGEGFREN